jgi:hypothetical protein
VVDPRGAAQQGTPPNTTRRPSKQRTGGAAAGPQSANYLDMPDIVQMKFEASFVLPEPVCFATAG